MQLTLTIECTDKGYTIHILGSGYDWTIDDTEYLSEKSGDDISEESALLKGAEMLGRCVRICNGL